MEAMDDSSNQSTENEIELNSSAIAEKVSSGELTTKDVSKKSRVWDVFSKLINQRGGEVDNFVCCKNCKKILKYTNRSTSNLTKHKCYVLRPRPESETSVQEVDEDTKKQVAKIMSKWIIKSCRPYNMVNDDGLREIVRKFAGIGARYGSYVNVKKALPQPATIVSSISHFYEQCLKKLKDEILLIQENGFGLTVDIWTDDILKKNYMALTMHFLREGVLAVRLLGLVPIRDEQCNSENIDMQIRQLLQEFGCDISFKTIIVTGKGLNMTQPFQTNLHLSCISSLLHTSVTKSMEEVIEVAELIQCIEKLVKYFEDSGFNTSLPTSLKSPCASRWSTTYDMLSLVEKNWRDIHQILRSQNELNRIESIEINDLKAVIKILETFEEATKALEAENNATMHLVLIYIFKLKTLCTSNDSNTDLTQQLTEKLLYYLNSLVTPNIKIFHKIAVFLYPPFNKLVQFSEVERENVYGECLRLLECFQNELPTVKEEFTEPTFEISERKELFLAFLPEENFNGPNGTIRQELQLYKNTNVAYSDDFNVFNWWEFHKTQFPFLHKLSCMVLSTPASCATSERIFSTARHLLNEKWSANYSNEVVIKQMMFLHTNIDTDEIFDDEYWSIDAGENKVLVQEVPSKNYI